jgi:predicted extracellular nuclease
MRVAFAGPLFVTETFDLAGFGEVDLAANSRLFNPTNSIDPNDNPASGTTTSGSSNVAAVAARAALNNRTRLVLDDNSSAANPNPIPYLRTASVGGGRTLRAGDSVNGLAAILSFGFGTYRLQPTAGVTFAESNPRTLVPPATGGNVRVASFNVLNYFVTFGGPNDRGADNVTELNRQRAKIVAALKAIDADVVGLIEMQNNGSGPGSAIHDLLNHPSGLNAAQSAAGQGVYSILPLPSEPFGTDVIKVAFIYKASRVTPDGAPAHRHGEHNRLQPPAARSALLGQLDRRQILRLREPLQEQGCRRRERCRPRPGRWPGGL